MKNIRVFFVAKHLFPIHFTVRIMKHGCRRFCIFIASLRRSPVCLCFCVFVSSTRLFTSAQNAHQYKERMFICVCFRLHFGCQHYLFNQNTPKSLKIDQNAFPERIFVIDIILLLQLPTVHWVR